LRILFHPLPLPLRENKNARKGIATVSARSSSCGAPHRERKQKRPQGHCDVSSTGRMLPAPLFREKTKTPARALRLKSLGRDGLLDPLGERKQKRPQGHCDVIAPFIAYAAFPFERKQKRPQGHCDQARTLTKKSV